MSNNVGLITPASLEPLYFEGERDVPHKLVDLAIELQAEANAFDNEILKCSRLERH